MTRRVKSNSRGQLSTLKSFKDIFTVLDSSGGIAATAVRQSSHLPAPHPASLLANDQRNVTIPEPGEHLNHQKHPDHRKQLGGPHNKDMGWLRIIGQYRKDSEQHQNEPAIGKKYCDDHISKHVKQGKTLDFSELLPNADRLAFQVVASTKVAAVATAQPLQSRNSPAAASNISQPRTANTSQPSNVAVSHLLQSDSPMNFPHSRNPVKTLTSPAPTKPQPPTRTDGTIAAPSQQPNPDIVKLPSFTDLNRSIAHEEDSLNKQASLSICSTPSESITPTQLAENPYKRPSSTPASQSVPESGAANRNSQFFPENMLPSSPSGLKKSSSKKPFASAKSLMPAGCVQPEKEQRISAISPPINPERQEKKRPVRGKKKELSTSSSPEHRTTNRRKILPRLRKASGRVNAAQKLSSETFLPAKSTEHEGPSTRKGPDDGAAHLPRHACSFISNAEAVPTLAIPRKQKPPSWPIAVPSVPISSHTPTSTPLVLALVPSVKRDSTDRNKTSMQSSPGKRSSPIQPEILVSGEPTPKRVRTSEAASRNLRKLLPSSSPEVTKCREHVPNGRDNTTSERKEADAPGDDTNSDAVKIEPAPKPKENLSKGKKKDLPKQKRRGPKTTVKKAVKTAVLSKPKVRRNSKRVKNGQSDTQEENLVAGNPSIADNEAAALGSTKDTALPPKLPKRKSRSAFKRKADDQEKVTTPSRKRVRKEPSTHRKKTALEGKGAESLTKRKRSTAPKVRSSRVKKTAIQTLGNSIGAEVGDQRDSITCSANNATSEGLLGYEVQDACQEDVKSPVPPQEAERIESHLSHITKGEKAVSCPYCTEGQDPFPTQVPGADETEFYSKGLSAAGCFNSIPVNNCEDASPKNLQNSMAMQEEDEDIPLGSTAKRKVSLPKRGPRKGLTPRKGKALSPQAKIPRLATTGGLVDSASRAKSELSAETELVVENASAGARAERKQKKLPKCTKTGGKRIIGGVTKKSKTEQKLPARSAPVRRSSRKKMKKVPGKFSNDSDRQTVVTRNAIGGGKKNGKTLDELSENEGNTPLSKRSGSVSRNTAGRLRSSKRSAAISNRAPSASRGLMALDEAEELVPIDLTHSSDDDATDAEVSGSPESEEAEATQALGMLNTDDDISKPLLDRPTCEYLNPLTKKDELLLAMKMRCKSREKIVRISEANVMITGGSFRRLRGSNWLDDELINAYAAMINTRNDRIFSDLSDSERENIPKTYIFNTYFFTRLSSADEGIDYEGVSKWTKRANVNILDYDLILVPVNLGNLHWVLAGIDLKEREVFYLDPMMGDDKANVMSSLKAWADAELRDKHGDETADERNVFSWNQIEHSYRVRRFGVLPENLEPAHASSTKMVRVPEQTDGHSCGVFAARIADCLSLGIMVYFAQADMDLMRKRMALDLLHRYLPL